MDGKCSSAQYYLTLRLRRSLADRQGDGGGVERPRRRPDCLPVLIWLHAALPALKKGQLRQKLHQAQ